jgi:hypothetical protein
MYSEYRFQQTKVSELDISFDFLPSDLHVSALPTRNARMSYVKRLKPFLEKNYHRSREP